MSLQLPIDKAPAANWIAAMEDAAELRYEGRNPAICIIVHSDPSTLSGFYAFGRALTARQALLDEKWIRSVIDGRRVALVADVSRDSDVVGMLALPSHRERDRVKAYSPHYDYLPIHSLLSQKDMVLLMSENGDLFVISGTGPTFQRHQGRWRFCAYETLANSLDAEIASATLRRDVTRAVLDLSYERKGALLCVLGKSHNISDLVEDHLSPARVNAVLRESVRKLHIGNWFERQIAVAAAATDGAVVFDHHGALLDAGCMIVAATPKQQPDSPQDFSVSYETLAGARARAAWRASFSGLAIKVSEDGPVAVYSYGREIARLL